MQKRYAAAVILLACLPLHLLGQEPVERIEVRGNERIPRETILFYYGLHPGNFYDPKAVERGVEALWNTGFFADIRVAVEAGEMGRIVILSVEEYPIVETVSFDTEKEIKDRKIKERLRAEGIEIPRYSVFSPKKIDEVKKTIEALLEDSGFNQGSVMVRTADVGKFGVQVTFHVRGGPRYRIGKIEFTGNPKLGRRVLLSAFRFNREHNLFSWIKGNDIFRSAKLDEDLENLKNKYAELGYAEAEIGEPRIEESSERAFLGGERRMKKIIIPVDAGERYETGDILIEGNENIPSRQLRRLLLLQKGGIYNREKKSRSIEKIRELYQNKGYLFVQIFSHELLDKRERRVDVTLEIREGEVAFLRRLHITGNTFTKDVVLRREVSISEQEKLRMDRFTKSIKKMLRLGMMGLEEQPELNSDPKNPSQVDIDLKVVEKIRNEWQLTGGYTGYQGAYFGGNLSVVDFLGAGEKMDLRLEYGERSKSYEIGFSEPYLFGRPASLRLDFFNRDIVYPDLFSRIGEGIRLGLDAHMEDYWWAGASYVFERVDAATFGTDESESLADQNISRISFVLFRDTVDNPFFPSGGMRCLFSWGFAGSELGSDIQYIKPEFEGAVFVPLLGNNIFGLHTEFRFIKPIRNSVIPPWERFYLGGERSLRGYEVYSIGPRNPDGRNVGGEKSLVFNVEYIMPLLGPLRAVLFFDAGNVFSRNAKIDLTDVYCSSGLEMRWRIPRILIPVRLIFAYNNRLIDREDSHFAFRIAFGASF